VVAIKFRNRYRIESIRLRGYDYSRDGAYFVTICTKNRDCIFGDVVIVETGLRPVSTINLSDIGKIVMECWYDLPNHYSNIVLDEFIIMPNHIHGIIKIQNQGQEEKKHGLSEFIRAFKSFSSRRINEFLKTKRDI